MTTTYAPRLGNIGEPLRTIEAPEEPLTEPAPITTPAPEPATVPAAPEPATT